MRLLKKRYFDRNLSIHDCMREIAREFGTNVVSVSFHVTNTRICVHCMVVVRSRQQHKVIHV